MKTLTEAEAQGVMERNSTLRAKVLAFNLMLLAINWDDVRLGSVWDQNLYTYLTTINITPPIGASGVYVADQTFGTAYVLVFPDAEGHLRFTATDNHSSAEFVGVSGLPQLPSIPSINAVVLVLGLIAIAVIVIYLSPFIPRPAKG